MLEGKKIQYKAKEQYIVKDIDFTCENGELVAILGPNGAGKSTFLNVIANELQSQGNTIYLKSCAYKHWCAKDLPKHKAKFSQAHTADIPLDVKEIIMMGRYPYFSHVPSAEDNNAVLKAMESIDISHLKEREYTHLSGGEKQRVHLARVLAQLDNPIEHKLLFLDEPLNNLDILHQHKIMEYIKNFTTAKNTAIVVLHDLNLAAQFADKILLLKRGKTVRYGTPDEVMTQEIISDVYNFPCTITTHPLTNKPLILFGK